jgi:hypothetical protein
VSKGVLMKQIKLNSEQLSNFLTNKYFEISTNENLELYNSKFVINKNGYLYKLKELDMSFEIEELPNKFVINFIQNLICKHLNLESYMVIFLKNEMSEYVFRISFFHGNQCYIIVSDYMNVMQTMQSINDIESECGTEEQQIGLYKKLGNSQYYFRWIEDI